MIVTKAEILQWMSNNNGTILTYAVAHDMQPQEVIDMMNGKQKK